MDAKLVVVNGNASKGEIKLRLPMTIGRTKEASLTIAHAKVSRLHCQLYEVQGALVVRDNNSTNGTFVNEKRISQAVVKPGDRLTVGPLTFVAIYKHAGDFPKLGTRPTTKKQPQAAPADGGQSNLADLIGSSEESVSDKPAGGDFSFTIVLEAGGDLQVGTPVQFLNSQVGSVVQVRYEAGAKVNAIAQLSLAESLGSSLREDLEVEVRQDGQVHLEILSLGTQGNLLSHGQTVYLTASELEMLEPLEELEPADEDGSSLDAIKRTFDDLIDDGEDDPFGGLAEELGNENDLGVLSVATNYAVDEDDWGGVLGHDPDDEDEVDATAMHEHDVEPTQQVDDVNNWLKAFADLADDDSVNDAKPDNADD